MYLFDINTSSKLCKQDLKLYIQYHHEHLNALGRVPVVTLGLGKVDTPSSTDDLGISSSFSQ